MRNYESDSTTVNWIMLILVLIIVGLFLFSAYGCSSQPAQPAQIEAPAPDFYDRTGNACWRMNDLVWCDDGYGSWEDNEESAHEQAPEE